MTLGQRMDRDYERAVHLLLDDLDAGEIDAAEWAEQHRDLTASYERVVDTAAENLKEYGRP